MALNLFQQIYSLSSASNLIGDLWGTEDYLQKVMRQDLVGVLPNITGSWNLTWGPRVYKPDPDDPLTGPENVWFAAQSPSQRVAVVAIAGTAPCSVWDWLDDIDVDSVVDWDSWVATWSSASGIPPPPVANPPYGGNTAYISAGTANGVFNILSNTNTRGSGIRIDQYLQTIPAGYTVYFTGHSMGGAIAPPAALGLVQAKMAGNNRIAVLSSAAPTPGNSVFAAEYQSRFPKSSGTGYQVLNANLYNTDDIVPTAWSNLDEVLKLYAYPYPVIYQWIYDIIDALVWAITPDASTPIYVPIPGQAFKGTPITPIKSEDDLVNSVIENHTNYYWEYIGITPFGASGNCI